MRLPMALMRSMSMIGILVVARPCETAAQGGKSGIGAGRRLRAEGAIFAWTGGPGAGNGPAA